LSKVVFHFTLLVNWVRLNVLNTMFRQAAEIAWPGVAFNLGLGTPPKGGIDSRIQPSDSNNTLPRTVMVHTMFGKIPIL